ncbi:hypothetical protein GCM10023340_43510 [Nocardioides marinquilinus]|uniref:DUF3558 domain-containing protein n=1 Tax=Nocardioides marinquilinus TaxID=1210400 RepID=A0ABP9Q3E7_9ACTN
MPQLRRALAATALLTACTLTGCGGDGGDGDGDGASDPVDATPTAAAPVDDDAAPDDGGSGATFDVSDCSAIPAEQMGPVLGEGTASAEVPPGGGGCTYALDDPTLPSVFLEQFGVDDFADGFDGAAANVATTAVGPIDGEPETLDGIGDGAVVVAGPGEGAVPDAIGLVLVGDTIVRASLLSGGLPDDQAREITTGVLELVAGLG